RGRPSSPRIATSRRAFLSCECGRTSTMILALLRARRSFRRWRRFRGAARMSPLRARSWGALQEPHVLTSCSAFEGLAGVDEAAHWGADGLGVAIVRFLVSGWTMTTQIGLPGHDINRPGPR